MPPRSALCVGEPLAIVECSTPEEIAPASKILLVTHILVSSKKYVETGPLSLVQQLAIGQRVSATVSRLYHDMAGEV